MHLTSLCSKQSIWSLTNIPTLHTPVITSKQGPNVCNLQPRIHVHSFDNESPYLGHSVTWHYPTKNITLYFQNKTCYKQHFYIISFILNLLAKHGLSAFWCVLSWMFVFDKLPLFVSIYLPTHTHTPTPHSMTNVHPFIYPHTHTFHTTSQDEHNKAYFRRNHTSSYYLNLFFFVRLFYLPQP